MSEILVVAGSDPNMSDLDSGAMSARIDLNLNLAPPWSPDFLALAAGSGDDLGVDESYWQGQGQGQGQGYLSRRILPRFGPGIHGVFLDLQSNDHESQADQSAFAQVRGISPVSSSPSHEQIIPSIHPMQVESFRPTPPAATPAISQETVEQIGEGFYEQADAENIPPFSHHDSQGIDFVLPQIRHGFRRYMRPVTEIRLETMESAPTVLEEAAINTESPITRLVDLIKDHDMKEASSDEEKEGESANAANFECNVCLDMAVEPVLTSCGHLFCWPCLYQWLHIHSEDEECPVCKGSVTESDIIPIYGRGSKANVASQSTGSELGFVPPRPNARRTESLRQRLGSWVHGWEWDRDRMGEVGREDPGGFLWRPNEVLRMRRAFHFLQENIEGTLHTRVRSRRRMAERRERFRAPAVDAASNGAPNPSVGGIHEVLQRRVARLSERLQEDVVRRLALSRTEDRFASIRGRISNLYASEDSQRTVLAAISVSGQDGIVIPSATSNFSSSQIAHDASGMSIPGESASVQRVDITRQANEEIGDQFPRQGRHRQMLATPTSETHSSRPSGYADVEAESSHGRKRRRLN